MEREIDRLVMDPGSATIKRCIGIEPLPVVPRDCRSDRIRLRECSPAIGRMSRGDSRNQCKARQRQVRHSPITGVIDRNVHVAATFGNP